MEKLLYHEKWACSCGFELEIKVKVENNNYPREALLALALAEHWAEFHEIKHEDFLSGN